MLDRVFVLSSLAFLLVVSPLISFLYQGRKRKEKKTTWTAIAVVFAIFAAKLSFDFSMFPKNYYQALDVSRHSSPMAIRKSYVKISKNIHPDKNPAPDAKERFDEITQMKEVPFFIVYQIYIFV